MIVLEYNSKNKTDTHKSIVIEINRQINKVMEKVAVLPYRGILINRYRKKERNLKNHHRCIDEVRSTGKSQNQWVKVEAEVLRYLHQNI